MEVQVQDEMERVSQHLEKQTVPEPLQGHADMLKRILSTGIYPVLKKPIPECIAEDQADGSTVRQWPRDLLEERTAQPKQVRVYK